MRKPGIYGVDANSNLGDYERADHYQVKIEGNRG